jgi:hypothetical protein
MIREVAGNKKKILSRENSFATFEIANQKKINFGAEEGI